MFEWTVTYQDGTRSTVHAASRRAAITLALLNDRRDDTTTTHITRNR